jgi:hypothetical protein
MPDDSGDLAVNTRTHTHYQYARTRLRVHWAPGIPHALCFRGGDFLQTSGATRRENAKVCLSCLDVIARSEATKQSNFSFLRPDGLLRCARNDDPENWDCFAEPIIAQRFAARNDATPARAHD